MKPLFLAFHLIILPSVFLSAQTGSFSKLTALSNLLPFSTPPFGLAKVQSAIRQLGEDHYGSSTALSQSQYADLTLDEKFTYNMIHLESFGQMCSILPFHDSGDARIYAELPRTGEYRWSSRQYDFFKNNSDTVDRLLKEVIAKDEAAGLNLLEVIGLINATDLIPSLLGAYRRHPYNHYILTTLMQLMKSNKFSEFRASPQYARLYGPEQYKYITPAYLPYTKANEEFILQQADNFYHDSVRH